ncbi:MAG: 30S ribosomal protein S8 [Patescibacteria group bacterium]|nr:30S ribosomal protein S8 [Patescibacteria group bacterium]MDD4304622.1 30S ribosomal protein S8 [Patescibacteria group bacterium]MDD4695549.1 30S ribosomal protein S8 [Patescibacteria group bacterium]
MMTDPIADMLTRIRNAQAVKKQEVVFPFSKIKYEIAKLLVRENFIESAEKISENKFDQIKIVLKYKENGKPFVEHIKRISKPGQRVYINNGEIPNVLNDLGLAILSTSQGIMTNKKARRMQIGGELLFEIW